MKLVILLVIVGFFFTQTVFGQTYEETELKSIYDSKYIASAQIELRNVDGNLLSITNANAIIYLDDPIVDEFLDGYDVIDIVDIDDIKYELRQIVLTESHSKKSYVFVSFLKLLVDGNETIEIFRALNHGFATNSGDVSTITWSILRQVS